MTPSRPCCLYYYFYFSFIEIEYLLILFSNRQRPLWKQCGEDRVLSVPKGHAIHIYFFRVIRRGVFCQWWQRQSTGVSSQVQIERDLYNNDCYPDNRIKFTPDYVPKRRKKQQRCDLYVNMLLYKTVVKPNWMLVQLLNDLFFRFEHVHGCPDGDRHCFRVPGGGDIFRCRCCIYDITLS